MTTEEKLQHFYDFSMESAQKESEQILTEYKAVLNNQFHEHQLAKKAEAQAQLNNETSLLKRNINKTLSAEQLTIKRKISKKQNEIKDELFDKVKEKLMAYKETPDYLDYICRKIDDAEVFASGDAMTLYIDPSDAALLEAIQEKTGVTPTISREVFLGGMRAVISSKNILIDNSFLTLLTETKHNFTFDGGIQS